jgi:hypothetical protein
VTEHRRFDDAALVWDDRRPPRRPDTLRHASPRPETGNDPTAQTEAPGAVHRISLREASERYGISTSTLGGWCRSGQVDGVLADGPSGRRWMVTPASVAERVATGHRGAAGEVGEASSPGESGAMLVPRAAWEKLMDQLGNLHQAGQQLAEARERAARYETEAVFLRERLAELRAERDQLRSATGDTRPAPPPAERIPGWQERLRRWWRGTGTP